MTAAADALLPLQEELYGILIGDSTLTTLLGGNKIYDFIPDNEAFPYIHLGETTADDRGAQDHDGYTIFSTFDVWSRPSDRGKAEALTIMSRIRQLIHNADINVSGYTNVSCRYENSTVLVDPDCVTYHGIIRFRILLGGI